jgi:hypothetical protein
MPVLDAGNWIALAALALAFVSSLLGLLWYLTGQIDQERKWREEADEVIRDNHNSFKLEATRTYVTSVSLEKSEERLAIAIDRLTARLEMVITRIEALSSNMSRYDRS